jgi:hypothetical protein
LKIPSTVSPGKSAEFRFIQKLIPLSQGRTLSPANIVFYDIPKSSAEMRNSMIPGLAEELRKGLGLKIWKTRKYGKDGKVFESFWGRGNRMVRLMASENPERLRYSISVVRPGYAMPAYLEAELMQRAHLDGQVATASAESVSERLLGFFVPQAFAQSSGGYSTPSASGALGGGATPIPGTGSSPASTAAAYGYGAAGTVSSAYGAATSSSQDLGVLIDTINTNSTLWQETLREQSAIWQGQSDAWQVESAEWRNESSQWRGESGEWRELAEGYSEQLDQLSGDAFKRVDQALALGDRALDILDKALSPENAALMGAAGAAGAVLGGFAMNAMIDGVIAGGKALITLLSGEKVKEERLSAFLSAREYWEKTSPLVVGAERQLDIMLDMLESSVAMGKSRTEMVDYMVGLIQERIRRMEDLNTAYDATPKSCEGDRASIQSFQLGVEKDINTLLESVCALDPESLPSSQLRGVRMEATCSSNSNGALDNLCLGARDAFSKLAEIESNLQTARDQLLAGSKEYIQLIGEKMKSEEKSHRWAGRQPEKAERTALRAGRREVSVLRSEVEEKYQRPREAYLARCLQRCRVSVASMPDRTVSQAVMVPESCGDKIQIDLIQCDLPGEVKAGVGEAVRSCRSKDECAARISGIFDVREPLQKRCSEDVLARLQWCMRGKVRSNVVTQVGPLVCVQPGATAANPPSGDDYGFLRAACEDDFMANDPEGRNFAQELHDIDLAASGVDDVLGSFREGNAARADTAELRNPASALNPLRGALDLLGRVNGEYLQHKGRMDALIRKGARLKAACHKLEHPEK